MYTSSTDTPVTKKPEMTISKAELKEKVEDIKKTALRCLKSGFKPEAIDSLNLLQMGSVAKVDQGILDIDVPIFNLILQNEIPEALGPLLKSIHPKNRSAFIGSIKNNNYHDIEQFIERSLQLSDKKYQDTLLAFKKNLEADSNQYSQNSLTFMPYKTKETSDSRLKSLEPPL